MERCNICPANHSCQNGLGNDMKTYINVGKWLTSGGNKCCPREENQILQQERCKKCKKYETCMLIAVAVHIDCKLFESSEKVESNFVGLLI
jgi:hypothetical protein